MRGVCNKPPDSDGAQLTSAEDQKGQQTWSRFGRRFQWLLACKTHVRMTNSPLITQITPSWRVTFLLFLRGLKQSKTMLQNRPTGMSPAPSRGLLLGPPIRGASCPRVALPAERCHLHIHTPASAIRSTSGWRGSGRLKSSSLRPRPRVHTRAAGKCGSPLQSWE